MTGSVASTRASVANLFTGLLLAETDPEVAEAVRCELSRQRDEIELIASGKHRQQSGPGSAGFGPHQQMLLPRVCRGGAITAAASTSTSLKIWQLKGLRSFSDVNSQTFSRTRAPLPTSRRSWR